MQHIIKKQIILLELENNEDSFRIQQFVSEYYWKEIVPVLQKLFDAVSSQDEIVSIEHLEIDLGVISINDIEQGKWVDKLEAVLREELTKILRDIHSNKGPRRETSSRSAFSQWMYYMENGFLPWNTLKADQEWYNQTLQTLASDFNSISDLRKQILSNTIFTRRIILQHPESFLISLVETLTAEKQDRLPALITELYEILIFICKNIRTENESLQTEIDNKKDFIRNIWSIILKLASKNEKYTNTDTLVRTILAPYITESATIKKINKVLLGKLAETGPVLEIIYLKLKSSEKENRIKEKQRQLKNKDSKNKSENIKDPASNQSTQNKERTKNLRDIPDTPEKKQNDIANEMKMTWKSSANKPAGASPNEPSIPGKDDPVGDNIRDGRRKENLSEPGNPIEIFKAQLPQKEKSIYSESIDEEGIFVQNAGIVLLHPFLNFLFKRLGLITEEGFISLNAQQKAIQLLHFLGTGNTQPAEYELVVAKLLCAHPLQQPVETGLVVTETEINEANDLIAAAIAQWEILKSSSADALREGFLQRNGKLFSKKGRLNLIVEKSAIDILLDRLPWNLSMINLPWMNEILWVEWR